MFYQPGSLSRLTILLATTATTVPILVWGGVGVVAQSASNEQSEFPLLKDVPKGTQVRINGSSSMIRMNQALGQKFQSQYPQTSVVTSYDGTDAGLQAVLDGKADLAGMGRVLTDGEKAKGLNGTAVTRHKIAVFVGKDNPFNQSLTINQFAQIFRGQVTDWSKLGGKAGKIRLIDRPENSDTRTAFASYPVFKSAPFETGKNAVKLSEDSTDAVVAALGKDGIGYAIADQVVNNPNVRILAMHKVLPTDPRYPFSQPLLYAYKGDKPNLPAQAFLGLATAPATQAVVEQARLETAKSADSPTAVNPPATTPDAAATVTNTPAPGTDNAATVTNPPTGASTDDNVTSVQPANPDQVANAPGGTTTAESQTKFPWWLLLIPVLGGMLWWLLKNLNGASPVAVAPAAAAAGAVAGKTRESRIVLTPRDARNGYAYWEIPPTVEEELRRQGKRGMKLRLYDVTDIDMDLQTPHSVQEFDCRPGEQDLHIPIPMDNREYVAEIGYPESNGSWSRIARSQPVGFSSPTPASSISRMDNGVDTSIPTPTSADTSGDDQAAAASLWGDSPRVDDRGDNGVNGNTDAPSNNTEDNPNLGAGIAGVAAAGAGATLVNLFSQNKNRVAPPDPTTKAGKIDTKGHPRVIMVPRTPESAYVYWELPPEHQAQDKLMLRLYDATGVDNFDTSTALPFSTYECAGQNDLHVRIPESERDYVGELGYENPDGTWVKLTQTEKVRIPAAIPTDSDNSATETTATNNNPISATVAAVTTAASNGANTVSQNVANVADTARETATGWMSGVSQSMGNAIAGGTAAVAGVGSAANALWNRQNNEQPDIHPTPRQGKNPCQIILVPLNSQQAYAYWEISDEHKQAARSQGGSRFMLRVHDSTNLDIDYQQPHQTQEYPCNEQECDRHVTIPQSDRDYIAEVGYYTHDNRWIRIIRSLHVHVG